MGGCVAIRRATLHELLRAAVDVPVRLGTMVTELEHGDPARVSFSDGSTGSYDVVVGADGVHSAIRTLAFGDTAAGYVGRACWRSSSPTSSPAIALSARRSPPTKLRRTGRVAWVQEQTHRRDRTRSLRPGSAT